MDDMNQHNIGSTFLRSFLLSPTVNTQYMLLVVYILPYKDRVSYAVP